MQYSVFHLIGMALFVALVLWLLGLGRRKKRRDDKTDDTW
jgi:hypothetical protein